MSYISTLLQNAQGAVGDGTAIDVRGFAQVGVHFLSTGSPVGTVTFEGTINDADWFAMPVENAAGTLVTTATAAGYFRLPRNHALSQFRARISAYTSGNFTVVSARAHELR